MHVAEKDIRYIKYGDYGMDLYSNAIIVSKKLTKEHPEVVKGLIAAINHGREGCARRIRMPPLTRSPSASR